MEDEGEKEDEGEVDKEEKEGRKQGSREDDKYVDIP